MKILPPALAFAVGLAVAAGIEPRSGEAAASPPDEDTPGGPMLLIVDEQGAIVETVAAADIAGAISAIDNSTPSPGRLLILLVPVAPGARDPPRAVLSLL